MAITIVIAIIILLALYLSLVAPNSRRGSFRSTRLVAHRGLFEPQKGVPENSLAAFEAACRAGYAIELDVQITSDDVAVVFHDDELDRMCGARGDIMAKRYAELESLRLQSTDEHIPTFKEVLALVNGRVPLLVELKHNPRRAELVRSAMDCLEGYRGEYIMESFDPFVLHELRKSHPAAIRGQLVSGGPWPLRMLLMNAWSRPDFVAYDKSRTHSITVRIQRQLFRTPLAAWTLKTHAELESEKERAAMLIFDGFKP